MRARERLRGLLRSPLLLFDILARGRYPFVYDQMPIDLRSMSFRKRVNLLRAGTNLLYRRPHPWSMPLHMQFEPTNTCDLNCPVCPTGIGTLKRKAAAMDVDLLRRVMDEVGPYLLTLSLWAWGEPLLHPRINEILKILEAHDVVSLLSTNGQMLRDERVTDALTAHPPTFLICAIDGLSDETNSQYRAGSRLDHVLTGVQRLADMKAATGQQLPILHMRFIVMKHNQHEVPHIREFAERHRFDLLTIRTLSIIDTDAPDEGHFDLVPDDPAWRAYRYADSGRVQKQDHYCLQPFWFPTVLADGTLVTCDQDFNAQQPLGRIDGQTSFRDLWFAPASAAKRKAVRDNPMELSFCRNCPYRDRDVTDCSVDVHFLNPQIDYAALTNKANR